MSNHEFRYRIIPIDKARKRKDDNASNFHNPFELDLCILSLSYFFQRLFHITQVFSRYFCKNALPVNRGVHSNFASILGKEIAQFLGINTLLVQFILSAHDCGHMPFGHAIERKVFTYLKEYNLFFEHNVQLLHVVSELEIKKFTYIANFLIEYLAKVGYEKRIKPEIKSKDNELTLIFLDYEFEEYIVQNDLMPLVIQIEKIADLSAYLCHDILDCIKMGYLTTEQIFQYPILHKIYFDAKNKYGYLDFTTGFHQSFKDLIINDVVKYAKLKFQEYGIEPNPNDFYLVNNNIIRLSEGRQEEIDTLKDFMNNTIYRNNNAAGRFDMLAEEMIEIIFNKLRKSQLLRSQIKNSKKEITFLKQSLYEEIRDIIWSMTDVEVMLLVIQICPNFRKKIDPFLMQYKL